MLNNVMVNYKKKKNKKNSKNLKFFFGNKKFLKKNNFIVDFLT